jgi:hypothetical protein
MHFLFDDKNCCKLMSLIMIPLYEGMGLFSTVGSGEIFKKE